MIVRRHYPSISSSTFYFLTRTKKLRSFSLCCVYALGLTLVGSLLLSTDNVGISWICFASVFHSVTV